MNFIIKSGLIRGKPSCAATWTKSFASAEIADSRQILDFQILDPSICAAQTLSHSLNLFSVVQMENLQNHGTTTDTPFHPSRCSGNSSPVKGKWESPASSSVQLRAHSKGWKGRPSSSCLTMGTRQKAESLAAAKELRAPAGAKIPVPARRSSPRRAPVRGRI